MSKTNDELPAYLQEELRRRHLELPSAGMAVMSDMRHDGTFGETWAIVSSGRFLVFDIANPPCAPRRGRRKGPLGKIAGRARKLLPKRSSKDPPLPPGFAITLSADHPLDSVGTVATEDLVAGGLLTATVDGYERVLCPFSGSVTRRVRNFRESFGRLKGDTQGEGHQESESDDKCPRCKRPYTDPKKKFCEHCTNKRALFIRVLGFVPRYRYETTMILLCILGSSALGLLSPYIGGRVLFDKVLSPQGEYHGKVLAAVLIMAGSQLLSVLLGVAHGRINAGLTSRAMFDLKTDVFAALQRLSLGFYSQKQTGSLITGVNENAMQLQYFFHDGLPHLIVNAFTLVGIAAVMFALDVKMTFLVLLPVPLILLFTKKVFPRMWTLLSRRFRSSSLLQALINDNLIGVRVVKAFGKEHAEIGRFAKVNEALRIADLDHGRVTSVTFPLMWFIMGVGGLIVWAAGSLRVISGAVTVGTLITFTGYIGMIYHRLEFMTQVIDWWSSSMNAAHRIFEILDTQPDVADHAEPVRMRIRGAVKLEHVTFGYDPLRPVLHGIDLSVSAGEMVGLVGHSGAGKSTLINVLTRLYDVQEGEVSIDGVPVKKIALEELRKQVGMVLQETFLFTGSLAENIAYAKPDAAMRDIIDAARAANAHDFIVGLPDGYDTVIGRRGHNLSGGECQRIAIARAILHDPAILILDEATSSVDTETEAMIQQALERLVKGRTTIAIAHRLSTLRNAARLVVLEKGCVVELGTHEELMAKKGVYCSMMTTQREALKITGGV